MKIETILISLSLLFTPYYLSAQKINHFEFVGHVMLGKQKVKDVTIKVFDGNRCFSNYTTKRNGKFIFVGGSEKIYTLQFEKEGYATKRIIVNTKNTRKLKSKVDIYKFYVEMEKEVLEKFETSYNDSDFPAAIIEIDKSKNRFVHNKSYSHNIEKKAMVSNVNIVSK